MHSLMAQWMEKRSNDYIPRPMFELDISDKGDSSAKKTLQKAGIYTMGQTSGLSFREYGYRD